ncbi:MAG: NADH:ubiquinone oxidoreductase subunit NDUFA12 [Rickettsiales bacterium]|nr:NADH:ubiquinone oxidoreductase subunit NDUFA12 [Rickettsiales bacterium]|tara:strand:+ start:171 stop:533 length:363 start_codon:yes stop_codon:yes gene_type:complete
MATIGTRIHTFLHGNLVGRDEFGNRYYEEKRIPKNRRRKRWVIYKGVAEPTKVPAHWHGWLHYTHNKAPVEGAPVRQHAWQKEHVPNLTGTAGRYLPKGHVLNTGERAKTTADYTAWKPE